MTVYTWQLTHSKIKVCECIGEEAELHRAFERANEARALVGPGWGVIIFRDGVPAHERRPGAHCYVRHGTNAPSTLGLAGTYRWHVVWRDGTRKEFDFETPSLKQALQSAGDTQDCQIEPCRVVITCDGIPMCEREWNARVFLELHTGRRMKKSLKVKIQFKEYNWTVARGPSVLADGEARTEKSARVHAGKALLEAGPGALAEIKNSHNRTIAWKRHGGERIRFSKAHPHRENLQ